MKSAAQATSIDNRAPWTMRLNRSRPSPSAPSRKSGADESPVVSTCPPLNADERHDARLVDRERASQWIDQRDAMNVRRRRGASAPHMNARWRRIRGVGKLVRRRVRRQPGGEDGDEQPCRDDGSSHEPHAAAPGRRMIELQYSRIDECGDEIGADDSERQQECRGHRTSRGKVDVAAVHRRDRQPSESRPACDELHGKRSAEECASHQAAHRHDGTGAKPPGVTPDERLAGHPTRPGGGDRWVFQRPRQRLRLNALERGRKGQRECEHGEWKVCEQIERETRAGGGHSARRHPANWTQVWTTPQARRAEAT